jgi:hypothetical protein
MKKLFTNYNLELDKNERKILTTFLKQSLKQTTGDEKFFAETRAFSSVLDKLSSGTNPVKLTKDERTRVKFQIEQNIKHLQKESGKGMFFRKWLYRSMLKQYTSMLENHFKG